MPLLSALARDSVSRLADASVTSPDVDAIALIAHTLGWEPVEVRTAAARRDEWPPDGDHERLHSRLA
ncbi:MAG: hypothetical protein WDZ57_01505, partial [Demequina sp.]